MSVLNREDILSEYRVPQSRAHTKQQLDADVKKKRKKTSFMNWRKSTDTRRCPAMIKKRVLGYKFKGNGELEYHLSCDIGRDRQKAVVRIRVCESILEKLLIGKHKSPWKAVITATYMDATYLNAIRKVVRSAFNIWYIRPLSIGTVSSMLQSLQLRIVLSSKRWKMLRSRL